MLFVYNPKAGRGQIHGALSKIIDVFVKAGFEVTIHPSQEFRDAYQKVLDYADGAYDMVACSGGDGTLDEVVTAMMKRNEKSVIGFIPAGSTNDFANSLKLPTNILEAANTVVNGQIFPCDVGKFNEGYFVYVAAFGLFTDVSYQTTQEAKNLLGHLAYVLEGAKRVFNVPSYKVRLTYDDGIIEDEFILGMVTNSRSVGGFRQIIGKNVVFDDGVFEVTLVKTPKNAVELQETLMAVITRQIDSKHVLTFKSAHMEFESEGEVPWTLDGEDGGRHKNVVIQNLHRELKIMIPAEKDKA